MKENLRENKGITLVALVITIIVLLILTTVTIKLVVDTGIIKHAQTAVDKYNTAQANELEKLDALEDYMNTISGNEWWKLTDEEKEELKDHANWGSGGEYVESYMMAVAEIEYKDEYGELQKIEGPVIATMRLIPDVLTPSILTTNSDKELMQVIYITSDEMANELQQNLPPDVDVKIQKGKWYGGVDETDMAEIKECPYSMSDFKEVYSPSYVERVLNSFK